MKRRAVYRSSAQSVKEPSAVLVMDRKILGVDGSGLYDVLGLRVEHTLPSMGADFVVCRCILPKGTRLPLRKHQDRIAFVMLSEDVSSWWGGAWRSHRCGEVVDFSPWASHSLFNRGPSDAELITITTHRMRAFFLSCVGLKNISEGEGCWSVIVDNAAKFGVKLGPQEW